GKLEATIPLPGKPEFAVTDSGVRRVFVNIEDKSEVVAIDTDKRQIVATWPIAPGETPTGLAIDPEHHRLFIGCENELMVMMDSQSGKVLTTVPIGKRVDGNAFDRAMNLAFSANGEGTVTIAAEEAPNGLRVVQTLVTQPG